MKRRRNILSQVKGYRFGRSKKKRQAIEAIHHAQLHAFAHRKDKKNDFRRLWTTRLSAALEESGQKYNVFIHTLRENKISLNRKILSLIAANEPEAFSRFLKKVSDHKK